MEPRSLVRGVTAFLLCLVVVFITSFSPVSAPALEEQPVCVTLPVEQEEEIVITTPYVVAGLTSFIVQPLPYYEVATQVWGEAISSSAATITTIVEEAIEEPALDKTKPIYVLHDRSNRIVEYFPVELQWHIRDLAEEYGFDERLILSLIRWESEFRTDAIEYINGRAASWGLCQINRFWITGANIEHFTDDYRNRDLLDPYDNLLTLMEIWYYAIDAYNLDVTQDADVVKLLYWHNTGRDPRRVTSWGYATSIINYRDSMQPIEY